jgi:large subunit ribosomal protein L21
MYGIVEITGHQYKVTPGEVIDVDKLGAHEAGATIELDKVLFIGGDKPLVGLPTVTGAKITAKVIRHDKARKILVFKRRPGLYQKKKGHRKHYTALIITEIDDGNGNVTKIDMKSPKAVKYLK